MKMVLHAGKNDERRQWLKVCIEREFPKGQIILTDCRQHLAEALGRPLHNVSVIIAFITDSEGIDLLISLKHFFENIKLILVFGENSDEIQKSVFRLEPIYTTYSGNDFQDIVSVLKRVDQRSMRPFK